MKKTVFLLCFCMATAAVFAISKDSIIVNVGSKKKVVLYGETKEDLKDLEKIDLNKALKNMNKEMDLMSSKTRRLVVKDYDGNSYSIDSAEIHRTPWQKFVKNTHLNLYIGNVFGEWEILEKLPFTTPGPIRNVEVLNQISPHLGFSLKHGKKVELGRRMSFSLEKGIRYDYFNFKTRGVFMGYTTLTSEELKKFQSVKSSSYINESNGSVITVHSFEDGTNSIVSFLPVNNNISRLGLELIPTLKLMNKKKQELITVGLGLYGGWTFNRRQTIVQRNENTGTTIKLEGIRTNYSNTPIGVNFNIGYKNVQLYMMSDLFTNSRILAYKELDIPVKGRFRLSTIGIKIGR